MVDAAATMEKRFVERIRSPSAWAWIGCGIRRAPFAFGLALLPLVIVTLAVAFGPDELGKAMTDHRNVQETFARFVTAVATASSIAVSVASLTLTRQLKGVGTLRKRHEDNQELRGRLRDATGKDQAPFSIGAFLRESLDAVASHARAARETASSGELDMRAENVTLAQLLDSIERRAVEHAPRLEESRTDPDKLLIVALDFEADLTSHFVRRFRRDAASQGLREALADLEERLGDYVVAARYVKTMDTSWGLSNMSWAILLSTIPSILTAAFMVLAYGEGAVKALGRTGAGALIGLAMSVVILPLSFFVSYVLRFVFLNEHTLPTDGFVLGPEAWDAVEHHDDERRVARRGVRG